MITAEAAKLGIPAAALAAILKQESGFNALAKAKSSSASGIAQMLKGTADALGRKGCLNADGTPYSAKDRFDAEKSIHAAGFFMKDISTQLQAQGLPASHPDHWGWVAYGYNQGPGSAARVGPRVGWNLAATAGLPVIGRNDPKYWLHFSKTASALGGLK
jgi:soluble lytic murein transglycosylase-like protein